MDFAKIDFGTATGQVDWFKIDIHSPPVIRQVAVDYTRAIDSNHWNTGLRIYTGTWRSPNEIPCIKSNGLNCSAPREIPSSLRIIRELSSTDEASPIRVLEVTIIVAAVAALSTRTVTRKLTPRRYHD